MKMNKILHIFLISIGVLGHVSIDADAKNNNEQEIIRILIGSATVECFGVTASEHNTSAVIVRARNYEYKLMPADTVSFKDKTQVTIEADDQKWCAYENSKPVMPMRF